MLDVLIYLISNLSSLNISFHTPNTILIMILHYITTAIQGGPMGTCFSCFSPSTEDKMDTATVSDVSGLSNDASAADETREEGDAHTSPTTTAAASDDDGREGIELPLRKKQQQGGGRRFKKKIRSMSDSVKKGVVLAAKKGGASLVDTTTTMQYDDKSVASAIPAFVGTLNARVKETSRRHLRSMSASVNKAVARAATHHKKGGPTSSVQLRMTRTTTPQTTIENKSLLPYDCFLIVLSGHHHHKKCPFYMVRLPHDRNTTFRDLRLEIEEDYGTDFPFDDFKFTVAARGTAVVSRVQERKWRVGDYDLSEGTDGTYINPHRVYVKSIKKNNEKMEDKEDKNNDEVKARVRWVEGEKEGEKEADVKLVTSDV